MKIRVTTRFYLLLVIIVLIVAICSLGSCSSDSETVAMSGVASDTHKVKCVIIRDETLVTDTQVTYYEFTAAEHTLVQKDQGVINVYKNGNMPKLLNELNTARKNIQEYHKLILGNELDSQLEVLDLEVREKSKNLKELICGTSRGGFSLTVSELCDAMDARRAHMSATQRNDTKLMKYYSDEGSRLNAISSNRTVKTAPRDGLLSFYTDGYENALSPLTVSDLSIGDINTVLSGGSLGEEAPRSSTNLFRVVDQNHWWVALKSTENDESWNPTLGTVYQFRVTGYDDLVYEGEVINVAKNGTSVMAILEISQPLDAMMYVRTGSATIGANMSGLLVEKAAVVTVSGQVGVWKSIGGMETFVPVQVLTYRKDGTVLVKPTEDGALVVGDRLLIK